MKQNVDTAKNYSLYLLVSRYHSTEEFFFFYSFQQSYYVCCFSVC